MFFAWGACPCCCAATASLANRVSASASQRVVGGAWLVCPTAANHPTYQPLPATTPPACGVPFHRGELVWCFLRLLRRFCAFCVLPPLGLRLGSLSHPSELSACCRHCRAEPAASYRHSRAGGNPLRRLNQDMDSRLRGNDRLGG